MNQSGYSKISFYSSIAIFCLFFLILLIIYITPSPALCEGLADLFTFLSGLIGFMGTLFSIIGIREHNSIKKWFGLVVNLFFVTLAILDLYGY
jgi:hypothetical protein